jgi:hypothetical protein
MSRDFRPDSRESAVISKLDHAKENQRVNALNLLRQHLDEVSLWIAIKLIEERLVETTSKDELERQIQIALQMLLSADEFDLQFQTANLRAIVPRPHFVSLFVTAFIVEKLIDHPAIVEIYGADEDIYKCVHKQVMRFLPMAT